MNKVYKVYQIIEMQVNDESSSRSRYVDQLVYEASFFSENVAMDYVRQSLFLNREYKYAILPVLEIVEDLREMVVESVKAVIALCGYETNSFVFCLSAPEFYLHVEHLAQGVLKPKRMKLVIMPTPLKMSDSKGVLRCYDLLNPLLKSEMDVTCIGTYSGEIMQGSITIK